MRRVSGLGAGLFGLAGLAACSSGGDAGAALTMDELRATGDTCPVDLAGTGLAPDDAGEVEVDAVEGPHPATRALGSVG